MKNSPTELTLLAGLFTSNPDHVKLFWVLLLYTELVRYAVACCVVKEVQANILLGKSIGKFDCVTLPALNTNPHCRQWGTIMTFPISFLQFYVINFDAGDTGGRHTVSSSIGLWVELSGISNFPLSSSIVAYIAIGY